MEGASVSKNKLKYCRCLGIHIVRIVVEASDNLHLSIDLLIGFFLYTQTCCYFNFLLMLRLVALKRRVFY